AMVSKGRLGPEKFVELTSAAPARIYNLYPRKGCIAAGADADVVVWDPNRKVTIEDTMMHDRTGFTPFVRRTVQGWPDPALRRGVPIVKVGPLTAKRGSGQVLPRSGGVSAHPLGKFAAEMDPNRNYGASLI